jgi:hypothetical protein
MSELLEALFIFSKYADHLNYPIACESGVLRILANPEKVREPDKSRLSHLGFWGDEENKCFLSRRFCLESENESLS